MKSITFGCVVYKLFKDLQTPEPKTKKSCVYLANSKNK